MGRTGGAEKQKKKNLWEELIHLLSLHKSIICVVLEPNLMERNLSEFM
jgi:hypothetical protein